MFGKIDIQIELESNNQDIKWMKDGLESVSPQMGSLGLQGLWYYGQSLVCYPQRKTPCSHHIIS